MTAPPDIKIESRTECPYSTVFGVTEEGASFIEQHGLPPSETTGGWFVHNQTLVDLIGEASEKGLVVA